MKRSAWRAPAPVCSTSPIPARSPDPPSPRRWPFRCSADSAAVPGSMGACAWRMPRSAMPRAVSTRRPTPTPTSPARRSTHSSNSRATCARGVRSKADDRSRPERKRVMQTISIDGIPTRYEIRGSGPPLLMFSPGGFDATIDAWASRGAYAQTRPLEHLSRKYACIVFDRRESGGSGGRVERITWSHYVSQGKGLLEHLDIERAHLMGGCMGCSPVLAFAVAHPQAVISMVLYWPAGGPRYRLSSRQRFAEHLAFAHREGLQAVVALARASGKPFGTDPRVGPWASVIRSDPEF